MDIFLEIMLAIGITILLIGSIKIFRSKTDEEYRNGLLHHIVAIPIIAIVAFIKIIPILMNLLLHPELADGIDTKMWIVLGIVSLIASLFLINRMLSYWDKRERKRRLLSMMENEETRKQILSLLEELQNENQGDDHDDK